MDDAMTMPQKLKDLAISDTGFLFDPYTGSTFSVNDTGLMILNGLREGLSRGAIMERLHDRFEITNGVDLERDFNEFLHLLHENDLVPEDFSL